MYIQILMAYSYSYVTVLSCLLTCRICTSWSTMWWNFCFGEFTLFIHLVDNTLLFLYLQESNLLLAQMVWYLSILASPSLWLTMENYLYLFMITPFQLGNKWFLGLFWFLHFIHRRRADNLEVPPSRNRSSLESFEDFIVSVNLI